MHGLTQEADLFGGLVRLPGFPSGLSAGIFRPS